MPSGSACTRGPAGRPTPQACAAAVHFAQVTRWNAAPITKPGMFISAIGFTEVKMYQNFWRAEELLDSLGIIRFFCTESTDPESQILLCPAARARGLSYLAFPAKLKRHEQLSPADFLKDIRALRLIVARRNEYSPLCPMLASCGSREPGGYFILRSIQMAVVSRGGRAR